MSTFFKQSPQRRGLAALTAAFVVGSSLFAGPAAFAEEDNPVDIDAVTTEETPVANDESQSSDDPTESDEDSSELSGEENSGEDSDSENAGDDSEASEDDLLASGASVVPFAAMPPGAGADTITVNSLGVSGDGTLRAAIESANASTNTDGTNIVFDEDLAGTGKIELDGGADDSMYTDRIGNAGDLAGSIGPDGARYVIDSEYAVSIDFTNLDGIDGFDRARAAGFYIVSDNVTLTNLADFRAAEAGIAAAGSDITLSNIKMTDPATDWMENGVVFLDGASGVTVDNVSVESVFYYSFAVDTAATVSNIVIENSTSRGVHAWAHIGIEDDAIVNGFTVDNTKLGDNTAVGGTDEASPVHGFWMNPGIAVTGLEFTSSGFHSARHDAFYFEGSGQTLTDTQILDSEFSGEGDQLAGSDVGQIFRVISDNRAVWNGLIFDGNNIRNAAATVFSGELRGASFTWNRFTDINDAGYAALQLGQITENVIVANNEFNRIWAHDTIRVQGTSATNVVIENNTLENMIANVSRSAVRIDAAGTDNAVRNNVLFQDLADGTLPGHADNHWAIYNSANAASATSEVGWEIHDNSIDGFGGRDRSQAPIVHNAIGKLPVWGNTFGVDTRGSFSTDVEHSGFWFFWNVWNARSNNTVQTFRAEDVVFDGTEATFTAVQPDDEPGNNPATTPVTVYVYWTAEDHAEVYLGKIDDVTPGQTLSISTTETDGFLRLQTQDANGNFSQYSAIDPDAESTLPADVEVTFASDRLASGIGEPGSFVRILDANGDEVLDENGDPIVATVDDAGNWSVEGLECATEYTAVQYTEEDGMETSRDEFTTAECPVDPEAPAAPEVTQVTPTGAEGTGVAGALLEVRDPENNVVATATVDPEGRWSVNGLECGTDYTVVQIVGELESATGEFTTEACNSGNGNGHGNGQGQGTDQGQGADPAKGADKGAKGQGGGLAHTGGQSMMVAGGIALLLAAAGAVAFAVARRRSMS